MRRYERADFLGNFGDESFFALAGGEDGKQFFEIYGLGDILSIILMKEPSDDAKRKIERIRLEAERREMEALSRRMGTEIRLAQIERVAITAQFRKDSVRILSRDIERLLARLYELLPDREAEAFLNALLSEDEEIRGKIIGLSLLSALLKLLSVPRLSESIDNLLREVSDAVEAANRDVSALMKEGINLDRFYYYIPTESDIYAKIEALRNNLRVLGRLEAFYKWLERFAPV